MRWQVFIILSLSLLVLASCGTKPRELLNVSYDPTRELYQEFNVAFQQHWLQTHNEEVIIRQSHGSSGSQARAIIDGLPADVATLALAYDIDAIAAKEIIATDWLTQRPNNSSPYTSTIVFLVRKGNPKQITDWDDLIRDDVSVITPNPKTSGGARWNYLAALGYAQNTYATEQQVTDFVHKLYHNVAVLDTGARASTTTFAEKGIGDVLITWENEALLAIKQLQANDFTLVTPSQSILAEPSVAVVDRTVDERDTRELAEAYISYLYSEVGQDLAAKHFYRPRDEKIAERYREQFPPLTLFTVEQLGGWQSLQRIHFSDGGKFDQIYTGGTK
ncbi:MAG TPA: sulfate ABC transporter substrate-binding protein [Metalysinibacillus jejuensis]|uniref:Sulfate ABC transporter substrate-binding protein n=1 Tax=Metalysinibacillus jejuensis TaxID=914327 RepID=A0A921NAG3_9BACL|nr:sulfate ABC transporter substrate-binding protein [Metalysinibacillus jejuensis]